MWLWLGSTQVQYVLYTLGSILEHTFPCQEVDIVDYVYYNIKLIISLFLQIRTIC